MMVQFETASPVQTGQVTTQCYIDQSAQGGGLLLLDGGRVVEQFHYARPGRGNFWASDLLGFGVDGRDQIGARESA